MTGFFVRLGDWIWDFADMGRGSAGTLRGETLERWHEASATWVAMRGRIEEGFFPQKNTGRSACATRRRKLQDAGLKARRYNGKKTQDPHATTACQPVGIGTRREKLGPSLRSG